MNTLYGQDVELQLKQAVSNLNRIWPLTLVAEPIMQNTE
jgi:hypothetical protein